MEFRILGQLEVLDDGRALPLGGAKQRALLALLLLHANDVVSTSRLIDHLWGFQPPKTARHQLEVYASRLRKALNGGAQLRSHPPGYMLTIDRDQLDLTRFEAHVAAGRRAYEGGAYREASTSFSEAIRLWRGEPLREFGLNGAIDPDLTRIDDLRMSTVEDRFDCELALGRHRVIVGELRSLLEEHPLRERLRAQLMLALYRSGQQAAALAVYRHARNLLIEELGIEPGHELRELETAILRQDPALT